MARHPAIPLFDYSITAFPPMLAALTRERPLSLFWLDVNRASQLFGYRLRYYTSPNADVQITVALNEWLARLAAAAPPQLKLMGTGGDEVLVIAEDDDLDHPAVTAVCAMIEASQAPGIRQGNTPGRKPLTVACGGLRAEVGADGHAVLATLTEATRHAKRLSGNDAQLRSVVCWMGRDFVLESPGVDD